MLKRINILMLCVILLLSGCNKRENIEKEQISTYNKSATCYGGGIGDAVLTLKSNDTETMVVGKSIYYINSQAWINDKLGGYSYEEKIKDILSKQSDSLDKFTMETISSYVSSNRDDLSSYDNNTYKIDFEYKVNKSLEEYISTLENAKDYENQYSCIVDDDNSIEGTWTGVDNNFIYETPYNVKVVLEKSNNGILTATKVDKNAVPYDKTYYIKYNVVDDKLKVVYYEKKSINELNYIDFQYSIEYEINDNSLSYTSFGEKVTLKKSSN